MELDDFLLARVAEDADVGQWTPDRMQAHEASMRRVVDEYRERRSAHLAIAESDRSTLEKFVKHVAWAAFGEALRLLSEPYQGHAAYQPEWSPDWRLEPPPRRP